MYQKTRALGKRGGARSQVPEEENTRKEEGARCGIHRGAFGQRIGKKYTYKRKIKEGRCKGRGEGP